MESRHDGEGRGRLDGDVARAVGTESERGGVDARLRLRDGGGRRCGDGEAVYAVAVTEQRLQLREVQPDAILAARDLGGVSSAAYDRGYDGGVTVRAGCRRERDLVTDVQTGVGGEPLVYGYSPRVLRARTGARPLMLLPVQRYSEREYSE
jgi:hypothetical protein